MSTHMDTTEQHDHQHSAHKKGTAGTAVKSSKPRIRSATVSHHATSTSITVCDPQTNS